MPKAPPSSATTSATSLDTVFVVAGSVVWQQSGSNNPLDLLAAEGDEQSQPGVMKPQESLRIMKPEHLFLGLQTFIRCKQRQGFPRSIQQHEVGAGEPHRSRFLQGLHKWRLLRLAITGHPRHPDV